MVAAHDKIGDMESPKLPKDQPLAIPEAVHGPEDLFQTEARILASVMSARFQQELADPFDGYRAELKAFLGEHCPNTLE